MHTIWHNLDVSLDQLNEMSAGTMTGYLGIEFTEIGKDHLRATMPVDERTIQPFGILHGGASAVLAETLGSVASNIVIDSGSKIGVGMSINASHIRSARKGFVHGIAVPVHLGSTTHVWDIKIFDDEHNLICVSRLTVAILDKKVEKVTNKAGSGKQKD